MDPLLLFKLYCLIFFNVKINIRIEIIEKNKS